MSRTGEAMTDKPDYEAALGAAIMFDDDIGPCGDLARAYLALRSRVERVAGEMRRKRPSDYPLSALEQWIAGWADQLMEGEK